MEQAESIGISRRRLLAMSSVSAGATLLGGLALFTASGNVEASDLPTISSGPSTSFGPIKQIDSGLLNVGCAESGPANGPAVILLHGWPYDIYSFVDVAPLLAARGYRVIVPYMRGYGSTRFLSSETFRNRHPAVIV
jgi:pimeloyl-ACP methyl ester carboxylesterase